jgi:hypothetical protein
MSNIRNWLGPPMAGDSSDDLGKQALIRLEVACQLAVGTLPDLPPDTAARLREPIQTLCDVTRAELQRFRRLAKLT